MTEEEMAEEYKESKRHKCFRADVGKVQIEYESYLNNLKEAFLAGLKAGRPQWHDLRKNPNDLPESYYMSIVNQDGEKVMYDYSCKAWRYDDPDEYLCDTPIAWCEIPTFDKE